MKFTSLILFTLAMVHQQWCFNLKRSGVFLYEHLSRQDIINYANSEQRLDLSPAEVARIERCFYSTDWKIDREDECHWMTDLSDGQVKGKRLTSRDVQFRVAYVRLLAQSKADQELVKECYFKHRHEKVDKCRGISWGTCPDVDGAKVTERQKLRNFFWKELTKDDPEYYQSACIE